MKYRLQIEETVTYRHEIIVETDSESKLNKACDEVEKEILCSGSDYALFLKQKGFDKVDFIEDQSGDMPNIECTDLDRA